MGNSDIFPQIPDLPISGAARRLYQSALAHPTFSALELELALTGDPLEPGEFAAGLEQLVRLQLVVQVSGDPVAYTALSPENAARLLLGHTERQIANLNTHMNQLRSSMMTLEPLYNRVSSLRSQSARIEVIHGLQLVRDLILELSEDSTHEVLCSQPGGPRPDEVLAESAGRTERLLLRGVRMRTLYQHSAQFHQATIAFVEQLTALGAEVRTMADSMPRFLVFDRKVAVIGLRADPHGGILVCSPDVVDFLAGVFDTVWTSASPFPLEYRQEHVRQVSSEIRNRITELLVAGADDKVISRRLSLSQRTVQRHIAEVMHQLGATTRLHAGYLLGRAHSENAGGGEGTAQPAAPAGDALSAGG